MPLPTMSKHQRHKRQARISRVRYRHEEEEEETEPQPLHQKTWRWNGRIKILLPKRGRRRQGWFCSTKNAVLMALILCLYFTMNTIHDSIHLLTTTTSSVKVIAKLEMEMNIPASTRNNNNNNNTSSRNNIGDSGTASTTSTTVKRTVTRKSSNTVVESQRAIPDRSTTTFQVPPRSYSNGILKTRVLDLFGNDLPIDLIHVVTTRFQMKQGHAKYLAWARFYLWKTFCLSTLRQQSNPNFIWIILADPNLEPSLIEAFKETIQQSMPYSNTYLTLTNEWVGNNAGVNIFKYWERHKQQQEQQHQQQEQSSSTTNHADGPPPPPPPPPPAANNVPPPPPTLNAFDDDLITAMGSKEEEDDNNTEDESDSGSFEIVTGNLQHLEKIMAALEKTVLYHKVIVYLDTLLDSDDGFHSLTIQERQADALAHAQRKLVRSQRKHQEQKEKQQKQRKPQKQELKEKYGILSSINRAPQGEEMPPWMGYNLQNTWWITAVSSHYEWHNRAIYLSSSSSTLDKGQIGRRDDSDKMAISAGLTRIGILCKTKNKKSKNSWVKPSTNKTWNWFPSNAMKRHDKIGRLKTCSDPLVDNEETATTMASTTTTPPPRVKLIECQIRVMPYTTAVIKARTITSNSMDDVKRVHNASDYRLDNAFREHAEHPLLFSEHQAWLWEELRRDFGIDGDQVLQVSRHLYENGASISSDQVKARCVKGWHAPCFEGRTKRMKEIYDLTKDRIIQE